MRPAPEKGVEQWLADQPDVSVFISAITEASRTALWRSPVARRQAAIRPCHCHRGHAQGRLHRPHFAVRQRGGCGVRGDRSEPPSGRPTHCPGRCANCRHRTVAGCCLGNLECAGFCRVRPKADQPMGKCPSLSSAPFLCNKRAQETSDSATI